MIPFAYFSFIPALYYEHYHLVFQSIFRDPVTTRTIRADLPL
jgi:hypothetical protein